MIYNRQKPTYVGYLIMDSRIINTKRKIREAYLELLFKQEPSTIQVKELCKKARINRSTFYDRYGFIEALENEIIEEQIQNFIFHDTQIDALPTKEKGIDKNLIKEYILHFVNNKILCRYCTVQNKEKYVDIIVHKQLLLSTSNLTKISYYSAYFQCIGALATLIEWINDNRGQTIDEIVDIVCTHSIAMFS